MEAAPEHGAVERLRRTHGVAAPTSGAATLADLAERPDLRDGIMALELTATPGLDRRAQGAYLTGNLASRLGRALAVADLTGLDASRLGPQAVAVRARLDQEVEDGEVLTFVAYDLDGLTLPEGRPDPDALGRAVEHLLAPLVEAVAAQVRLGRAPLWRLVADGIAAGFLNLGRALRCPELAMDRAMAVLSRPGSPLRNRQLRFLRVEVPAAESPSGESLRDWFRLRGGCCRLYTAPGGVYCPTCVLSTDHEARFREHLIAEALAGAGAQG